MTRRQFRVRPERAGSVSHSESSPTLHPVAPPVLAHGMSASEAVDKMPGSTTAYDRVDDRAFPEDWNGELPKECAAYFQDRILGTTPSEE